MRPNRTIQFALLSLIITLATLSQVASDTHESSVPGIEVLDGFDAEVVSEGLWAPFGLALDADNSILVGSNCEMCPALRLSHDGLLTGASNWIVDPDGVAVDSSGTVLVAGDQTVTLMNSFASGVDQTLADGFSNLNDIVVGNGGAIFVYDSNGEIWQISSAGDVGSAPFAITASGGGISHDPLTGGLLVTTGPPSDLVLAISPGGTATEIAAMPAFSNPADAAQGGGGRFGNSIYVTLLNTGEIVTVDRESGDSSLFARGFSTPARLVFEGEHGVLVSDLTAGRIIRIFPVVTESIQAQIDIRPSCINPKGHGSLPVVIFGSPDLDVGAIDFASLDLEGFSVKARPRSGGLMVHFEFVNDDDLLDAFAQFDDNSQWTGTGDTATLTGMLLDETPIEGTDSICIVPHRVKPSSQSIGRSASR